MHSIGSVNINGNWKDLFYCFCFFYFYFILFCHCILISLGPSNVPIIWLWGLWANITIIPNIAVVLVYLSVFVSVGLAWSIAAIFAMAVVLPFFLSLRLSAFAIHSYEYADILLHFSLLLSFLLLSRLCLSVYLCLYLSAHVVDCRLT